MLRRSVVAVVLLALQAMGAACALAVSVSPSASASPSPGARDGELLPATILIALALIGGLDFARKRMERGAGGN